MTANLTGYALREYLDDIVIAKSEIDFNDPKIPAALRRCMRKACRGLVAMAAYEAGDRREELREICTQGAVCIEKLRDPVYLGQMRERAGELEEANAALDYAVGVVRDFKIYEA